MSKMRFGAFLAPHHPIGEHPTLQLQSDLELVTHMDKLGYDEFWCGEHHSTGWEIIASPEIFLAGAAERTQRIKLGTGVISLPYHHPFMVAQRLVQLDHQSRGRLIFGSGPGALPSDAHTMGIDPMVLRDRQDEAMGVIKNPIILKFMDWLESITYRSASICIGLSPGIVKGIKKKVPSKHLAMIPNGCDLNLVINRTLHKSSKKFIAVFTGAHGFANGLDAVLNAAKILVQNGRTDIELQFIGDGILKPKLIKRAEEEGLTNCIFLEPMSKSALFTYLKENANIGLMILDNIPI